MTLTLTFQGQIWNSLYLGQKWSDCHERKSRHFDWTLCLKCDHCIWLWPWPWLWIFKVKFGICFISAKDGLIATKWKASIQNELNASIANKIWPWPWPWKVRCKDLSDSNRGDFRCRRAVDSSSFSFIFHLWIMYLSTVLLARYVLEIRGQCKLNKVMAVHRFTVTIWEISSSGMINIPSSGFLTKYICRIALLRFLCTFGSAIIGLYTYFDFCKILFIYEKYL